MQIKRAGKSAPLSAVGTNSEHHLCQLFVNSVTTQTQSTRIILLVAIHSILQIHWSILFTKHHMEEIESVNERTRKLLENNGKLIPMKISDVRHS